MFRTMVYNGWRYEPLLAAIRFLVFTKIKIGDKVIGINIGLMCGDAGRCVGKFLSPSRIFKIPFLPNPGWQASKWLITHVGDRSYHYGFAYYPFLPAEHTGVVKANS